MGDSPHRQHHDHIGDVLDVAEVDVQRRQQDAERESVDEDEQHGGEEPQHLDGRGKRLEDDRAAQEHEDLDEEHEAGGAHARQREDLAREVDLLDESRIAEDRRRRPLDHLGEEAVDRESCEQEDRELRDAFGGPQELAENEVVHQELHDRPDQRPQEAEHAVAVSRLQVPPDQESQQIAAIEDLAELSPAPGELQSTCVRRRKRGLGDTSEPISRVQVPHLRQSTAQLYPAGVWQSGPRGARRYPRTGVIRAARRRSDGRASGSHERDIRMSRVVVTGAAGYLGPHVVTALLDRGHDVVAAVRPGRATGSTLAPRSSRPTSSPPTSTRRSGAHSPRRRPPRVEGRIPAQLGGAHVPAVRALRPAHRPRRARRRAHRRTRHDARGRLLGGCDRSVDADRAALAVRHRQGGAATLAPAGHPDTTSLAWARAYYIYGDDRRSESIFRKLLDAADEGRTEFPFTTGKNRYDFIRVEELGRQLAALTDAEDVTGTLSCCSGVPVSLAQQVEQYIAENDLGLTLQYGAFPDRPYDSPGVWGDATVIREVMSRDQRPPLRLSSRC